MIEHTAIEGALVTEGIIQAGTGDPGMLDQIPDRGQFIAPGPETPGGRIQNLFFVEFPRARHGERPFLVSIHAIGILPIVF